MSKKITIKNIENMGLYYLDRYSAPTPHFKTVMLRKIKRRCTRQDIPYESEYADLLDQVILKFQDYGYLDDATYARAVIKSQLYNGASKAKIKSKLMTKGIDIAQIDAYFSDYIDETDHSAKDLEIEAGVRFIKKKRIGCYAKDKDYDHEKALRQLAYAGYPYHMAKQLLEMSIDEADAILYR
jgi:regulatory protein